MAQHIFTKAACSGRGPRASAKSLAAPRARHEPGSAPKGPQGPQPQLAPTHSQACQELQGTDHPAPYAANFYFDFAESNALEVPLLCKQ